MRTLLGGKVAGCVMAALAGCADIAVHENKPLVQQEAKIGASASANGNGGVAAEKPPELGRGGYRVNAVPINKKEPSLFLVLSLSGGGKRSSAFSYGVLRGLRDSPLTLGDHQGRLLDEVVGIGSVSGGTFTAAYYGLHRDKIFSDFERDFLSQDLESHIYGIYLLPWRWSWMINPAVGTNDVMAKVYDDLMFRGATYGDLKKNGTPMIWIGATDISYGRVFTFNQDNFDYLCSDLDSYPIASAVAASNGFPIVFWPISLKNYADRCGGYRPSWLDRKVNASADTLARRSLLAGEAQDYLDVERTRYVHLADGGIADNLALRGLLNAMIEFSDDPQYLRARGIDRFRRLVIISVDGEASQDVTLAQERKVTGFGAVLGAVSGTMIDKYNFETLSLARAQLADLVDRLKKLRCGTARYIDGYRCDDVEGHVLHFSLSQIKDEAVRKRLQSIPTGLTIPKEDVDALVAAGETQVRESPDLAKVIKAIEQKPSVPVARKQ